MKNTFKAMILAAVMMFGATFAMAEGIIVFRGEKQEVKETQCTSSEKDGIIVFGAADGIIVFGAADGIIVFRPAEGIIVFGKQEPSQCSDKGRAGILVSD